VLLGRNVQKVLRWEATLDVLEGRASPDVDNLPDVEDDPDALGAHGLISLGHKATMQEWAKACGFENEIKFANELRRGRDAKQIFIESNLRLVVSIAKRWRYHSGSLALLDLIQEGTFALVRAIEKFDPEKGFKLSSLATTYIRHALWRAIENKGHMIRLPANKPAEIRELTKVVTEISTRTGRSPTDAELMEYLKISEGGLVDLQQLARRGLAISTEDMPDWRPLVDREPLPGEVDFMKSDMDTWLQTLHAVEEDLLRLRFGLDGGGAMTYREIGSRLGMSHEHARMKIKRALWKMQIQQHRFEGLRDYIE